MTGKVVNFLRKEKHRGKTDLFPPDAFKRKQPVKTAEFGIYIYVHIFLCDKTREFFCKIT